MIFLTCGDELVHRHTHASFGTKRTWKERRRPIYDSCLTDSYPHQSYSLHASLRYAFRSVALMWSQSIFERCSQMSCGLHWYSLFDSKKMSMCYHSFKVFKTHYNFWKNFSIPDQYVPLYGHLILAAFKHTPYTVSFSMIHVHFRNHRNRFLW